MPQKYVIPLKVVQLDPQSFHLLVEASLNNIPVNLVIDTGASRTVFDKKSIVEGLDDPNIAVQEMRSAGIMADHIESKMALAEVFSIGDLKLKQFPVILIDLDAINRLYMNVTGLVIHGLLGSDFLVKMRAIIDYKKLVLILRKPE